MKFTPKKTALFIIFIIYLIQMTYSAATTGNYRYITGNLSSILLLGALYLNKSEQSKVVVVLSVAYISVNTFLNTEINITSLLSFSTYINLIYIAGLIYFAICYFKSSVFDLNERLIITLLIGISLLLRLSQIINLLLILVRYNDFNMMLISLPLIHIAILIYMWIKEKPDNYNYY